MCDTFLKHSISNPLWWLKFEAFEIFWFANLLISIIIISLVSLAKKKNSKTLKQRLFYLYLHYIIILYSLSEILNKFS